MKVLVTGGTGFLGLYIVERLLARGDSVRVLARHPSAHLSNSAEFFQADICDRERVTVACRDMDAVIHTAAREGIEPNPRPFYRTNITGTKNIIHACQETGVSRFVVTSSPSVVDGGVPLEGVDETFPYPQKTLSYYAKSKRIAEELVLAANSDSLLTCAIRPRLLWGPRDRQLIPRLIEKAEKGELRQIGDGTNLLDITYVENAADAHILALDALKKGSSVPGSAYFISQGEPVNCWDWINRVLKMVGIAPVRKRISFQAAYLVGAVYESIYSLCHRSAEPPVTRFLATQLAHSYWFNIDRARRDLGYFPRVSTEEGAEKLSVWLKK